jgi:hypothetical protein
VKKGWWGLDTDKFAGEIIGSLAQGHEGTKIFQEGNQKGSHFFGLQRSDCLGV